jgi:hypothetical protein
MWWHVATLAISPRDIPLGKIGIIISAFLLKKTMIKLITG